jgi:hypothetical protein
MKKRTKKKAWKITKSAGRGIIVYPAKGIWYLTKKSYSGIKSLVKTRKEKKELLVMEKKRPQAVAKYVAFKEILPKKGKFIDFEEKLLTHKSMIGLILGARGTGKSAIGMRLLENFASKTEKRIYALGFKAETLPPWIKVVKDIHEIENGAVLLIDEGGIEFSSRKAMSSANTLLSDVLLISRHKDLSVLFITQNSSNLEINAIRQADFLILKPSSLLQKDFERKKIKDIYTAVQQDFDDLDDDGLTYIYSSNYQGFVSNSLPSFWSDKVSKGYGLK